MTEAGGYVPLPRKLLENPVWTVWAPSVLKVMIACLLKANWKATAWHDGQAEVVVPRGSFVTSYAKMAEFCRLSIKQIRCSFAHLKKAKFASYHRAQVRAHHRAHQKAHGWAYQWTMVTVLNYETSQGSAEDEGTPQGIPQGTYKGTSEGTNRRSKKEYPPLPPKGGGNVSSNPDELPLATLLDPLPLETGNGKNHNVKGAAKNGNGRAEAISDAIQQTAERIHARHPNAFGRRDCSAERVAKQLAAILRYKGIPAHEQAAYVESIDRTHAAMCASEAWSKDGGQFAKGLENWLAPTKERYLAEAAPAAPSTSGVGYRDMDDWKKGIVQ